jgi:Rieske Fe-S protein
MADETPLDGNTRRTVLAGVGIVGMAGVLTACGGSSKSSSSGSGASSSAPSSSSASVGGASSSALAKTSEIPVGGGKIFSDQKVVVTQPTAGEFKAFSAICTHQGCTVDQIAGGTIDCPCHGSKYNIATAAVVSGPAPRPLPAKKITVANGEITLA